jgi:thiol reductant ABC exporter CydC subunit
MSGAAVILRMLRVARPHPARVAASIGLGLATTLAGVGLLAASAYLISKAALRPPVLGLALAIVVVRALALGRAASRYAERLVSHDLALRMLGVARAWFYDRLEPLAPAGLRGARGGDLLARITGDVESLQNLVVGTVQPLVVAALAAAVAGATAWALLPPAGAVLAAAMVTAAVLVPLVARRAGRASAKATSDARGRLTADVVDLFEGLPELVAYGRAGDYLERARRRDAELTGHARRTAFSEGLGAGLMTCAAGTAAALVLAVSVPAVRSGSLDGLWLATLVVVALAGFEVLQPVPFAARQLESDLAAARRLLAVADAPSPVAEPPAPLPAPVGTAIALQHAKLRYEADAPPALDGVNLSLSPGVRIAVVGASGAGKTTIAQVLLRFRDLDAGTVTLDGRPIGGYASDDVRALLGIVEQEPHLFAATIEENLRLAKPAATQAELWESVRRAALVDWIGSLPLGLQTPVGERGALVSGGERRRLALARALLADFPVLILDEPTANLDALTARRLVRDVMACGQGRTLLLMTHDLAVAKVVDEVVVLERGRVVQRGPHAALLAAHGSYRSLWEAGTLEPVRSGGLPE